jgi:membrane fusion protein, multidrug efflux system
LILKRKNICWAVITTILISIIFISGCASKEKPKDEKMINVKVGEVIKKTVTPYIETVGTLKPFEEIVISPEVDGIVGSIGFDDGKTVKKGDVLAQIKDTDFKLDLMRAEAGLRQAEASLENTKTEYQRKEALLKEELVTRQQFDDVSTRQVIARNDYDKAKATLELARERLAKTKIICPVNGSIKEKRINAGDFARASVPIAVIVLVDPLKLSFTVSENNVSRVKKGQTVAFTVDAFRGREFGGKVNTIFPGLDERTRTLTVEALVSNRDGDLKAGFFAKVRMYTGIEKEAVLIPTTAIVYDESKSKVFILVDNVAHEKLVKTGDTYGDMIEVIEGLSGGERLIVTGQNNLAEGIKVNILK